MAAWTNIPSGNLAPGQPLTSAEVLALRDNPIALAEGAAGAPLITGTQGPVVSTGGLFNGSVSNAKIANKSIHILDKTQDRTAVSDRLFRAPSAFAETYLYLRLNEGRMPYGAQAFSYNPFNTYACPVSSLPQATNNFPAGHEAFAGPLQFAVQNQGSSGAVRIYIEHGTATNASLGSRAEILRNSTLQAAWEDYGGYPYGRRADITFNHHDVITIRFRTAGGSGILGSRVIGAIRIYGGTFGVGPMVQI